MSLFLETLFGMGLGINMQRCILIRDSRSDGRWVALEGKNDCGCAIFEPIWMGATRMISGSASLSIEVTREARGIVWRWG